MKLLLFSDIHCSHSAIQSLVKRSRDADVLVGAGDFGTMRKGVATTLAPLQNVDKPQILVCGNAESNQELEEATDWQQSHVLHGTGIEIQGVQFFGLGGGIPVTPFGSWSFDLDEESAAQHLDRWPQRSEPEQKSVLVVHSPPLGAVDVSSRGKHLGSESILAAIQRQRPRLVVCGHIHDSAGRIESIGPTTVVNVGPAGILWDLETNTAVTD